MHLSTAEGYPINTVLAFFVIVKKKARRQNKKTKAL
jgi:hypothetical protein